MSGSLRLLLKNMHDFTEKTQIAHTFTLFRPLGVFVWRRLLAMWGYWVGNL